MAQTRDQVAKRRPMEEIALLPEYIGLPMGGPSWPRNINGWLCYVSGSDPMGTPKVRSIAHINMNTQQPLGVYLCIITNLSRSVPCEPFTRRPIFESVLESLQ